MHEGLPEEIQLYIFSFLSGVELARASELGRNYQRLSNDEYLWKRLCIAQSSNSLLKTPLEEAYYHAGGNWKKLYIERFCYVNGGRCSLCFDRLDRVSFPVKDYDVFELALCWQCISRQIVSKTRAKKEYFLSEQDLFDSTGMPVIRNKTYENYFSTTRGPIPGSIVVPPIREFLKRDVEVLAFKKWNNQEGFQKETERRQQLRTSRQMTLQKKEKKRVAELTEALRKEGIEYQGIETKKGGYVKKRLREQFENYIKHGGQKRAKYTLTEIVAEAKLEVKASELLQELARVGVYMSLNQCYCRIKLAQSTFEELPSVPDLVRWIKADIQKREQVRKKRQTTLVECLHAQGIEASEDDDILARWGWEFKVVYDSYLEEMVQEEATKKLNEMLELVTKAQRIRLERKARAEQFEARFNAIRKGIAEAVPDLILDPMIDYTCLNAYYQHLHHCPDDSPEHTKEVVEDIVKKMKNMARRKSLLVSSFNAAGLGEPPFNSSELYSYDRKLTAFVQHGTGKISELINQRRKNLELARLVKEKKQIKAERTALLEKCLQEKGFDFPEHETFRFGYYTDLYLAGKLDLSAEEVYLLLLQQAHTLHFVTQEPLTVSTALSITAHLVALHQFTSSKPISVAALDNEWRLKVGFEYSKKGSRRLSDLLRANRQIFELSESGNVSLQATDPSALKHHLLRKDAIEAIESEWRRAKTIKRPPVTQVEKGTSAQGIIEQGNKKQPRKRNFSQLNDDGDAVQKDRKNLEPVLKRRSALKGLQFEE